LTELLLSGAGCLRSAMVTCGNRHEHLHFSNMLIIFNYSFTRSPIKPYSMATETTLHAHKYQHFEDLQLSAREFYKTLTDLIAEYKYPGVNCTAVTLNEGGFFSSKREYLKISKERYNYYVCASPFGRSFFISWWLQENANTAANVLRKMPLIGGLVSRKLEHKTFYEMDTELMFTSSINTIIQTAVAKLKADKGFRTDAVASNE
jgi:hypothetical protein